MHKDAEKYNNPDDFAKYGKLRRQLAKKEKDLPKLKEKAEKSKTQLSEIKEETKEKNEDECELLFEEAKNFDDVPLVPD